MKQDTNENVITRPPDDEPGAVNPFRPTAQDRRRLRTASAVAKLLIRLFGAGGEPGAAQVLIGSMRPAGKPRGYRKRPEIYDPVTGYRESYRDRRLRFIADSQRQGVQIAAARRHDYVQRRTNRHRAFVERVMPGMFIQALREAGCPMPCDPYTRKQLGGFDGAPVMPDPRAG